MKRLALLLAAVAACVLFTACPDNKPTDNAPVVIPDGTYRETCECVYSFGIWVLEGTNYNIGDTIPFNDLHIPIYDTVDIVSGNFLYNPCDDTNQWGGKTLIYEAPYYCKTGRVPVYVTEDGYAHFDSVAIYGFPFDFNYQVPVYKYGNSYRFDNIIHRERMPYKHFHKFTHTLERLY